MRRISQIKELRAGRPSRRSAVEHGVSGEEAGEHDDVAEEEDPEPKANDDSAWAPVHLRHDLARGDGLARGHAPACRGHAGRRKRPQRSRPRPRIGRQGLKACFVICPINAGDLCGWNDVIGDVTPGEYDEGDPCANNAKRYHPPDMPDQREPH